MAKRPPKIERRRRILAAARSVFAKRGYGGARMADSATEAGVGKGTLYEHFKGKEDLFSTLVLNSLREALEGLSPAAASGSPEIVLKQTIDYLVQVALVENLDLYRLFYDFWGVSAAYRAKTQQPLREAAGRFREAVGEILRRGQREGVFRPEIDPVPFAYSLLAAVDGLSLPMAILGDDVDLKRHREWLKELFVAGVRTESALRGASVMGDKS